ncbi:2-dehydro-3-deoxygluconate kinase, partial [Reticulomyxa filosa]
RVLGTQDDAAKKLKISDVAYEFQSLFGNKLVGITDGKRGSVFINKEKHVVYVDALSGITQVDSTGAGDAFFGGMLSYLFQHGIPTNKDQIQQLGHVARAVGAACVESLGHFYMFACLYNIKISKRLVTLEPCLRNYLLKNPIPTVSDDIIKPAEHITTPKDCYLTSLQQDIDCLLQMQSNSHTFMQQFQTLIQLLSEAVVLSSHDIRTSRRVYTTGIGKSGIVAKRFAASLSSISCQVLLLLLLLEPKTRQQNECVLEMLSQWKYIAI